MNLEEAKKSAVKHTEWSGEKANKRKNRTTEAEMEHRCIQYHGMHEDVQAFRFENRRCFCFGFCSQSHVIK